MSLQGQGVKTEILRILAGQVITVAAMADKLSYATVYEGASDTARYSSPNLVGQRPDGIAYVAAVQPDYFTPLAELRYFYDLTTLYRSEPNRLLHILHMLMLHLQTTRKEHVNRLAQRYPSEKVIVCFAQTAVFSESSQQPLEIEWASYIQPSIPQAHMPCDDDVQHNAVVKGVPHSQNENPLDRISSDGLKEVRYRALARVLQL
ncbi:hypothetical protein Tco_1077714 [Tanacetum coccineum]